MSWELSGKVIEDHSITDVRLFCVLLCLAESTNKETGLCYPSLTRISLIARCNRRTAIRAIENLEQKGWIQVIRRIDSRGSHLANVYRVIKYLDPSDIQSPPPSVIRTLPQCHRDTTLVTHKQKPSDTVTLPPSDTVSPEPRREEPRREPRREESPIVPLPDSPDICVFELKSEEVPREKDLLDDPLQKLKLRFGALFRRRPGTAWSKKEMADLRMYRGTPEADLVLLEKYYKANIKRERDFRRKSLDTLLHNLPGEIDRAIKYFERRTGPLPISGALPEPQSGYAPPRGAPQDELLAIKAQFLKINSERL